jgi:hypothetical protein
MEARIMLPKDLSMLPIYPKVSTLEKKPAMVDAMAGYSPMIFWLGIRT